MNLEQGQNAGWKHPLLSYSLLQNHCSWISWEYLMSASNVADLCVYFSIQFITVLFTMKLGERFYPSVFLNISSSSLLLFHFNFPPSPSSTCLSSSSSHLPFSQSISLLPPSPSFSPLLFSPFYLLSSLPCCHRPSLPSPSPVHVLPSSSFSSDLHPSLSPSVLHFLSLWWKREFWKREREREPEEEVEGEGWVSIRAAASSLHVARKTTLRRREGNVRWRTSTCTQGTPVGTHNLTSIQVRTPLGGGGRWRRERNGLTSDLWYRIFCTLPFYVCKELLTFCYIQLTGRKEIVKRSNRFQKVRIWFHMP